MKHLTKKASKKHLVPTMVLKSEKDKNYIYVLSNGKTIEFENKQFPTSKIQQHSNPNQLSFFN